MPSCGKDPKPNDNDEPTAEKITFGNYEGILPDAPGREWTECDIDTLNYKSRGSRRIVFSNDGLIYYSGDHYKTFELLYGEE